MKFHLFSIEISPKQLKALREVIQQVLRKSDAFIKCILAVALLVAVVTNLVSKLPS